MAASPPALTDSFQPESKLPTSAFALALKEGEQQLAQAGDDEAAALAHLRLASLNLGLANPKHSYGVAYRHLRKGVSRYPAVKELSGVKEWLAILGTHSRDQKEIAKLRQRLASQKDENDALRHEYEELNATLKKLQELDLELEKKKRGYRP